MEQYLPQCMETVLNQTYTNLEIIAVDDGSTDGSLAMLQEYAAHDPRVRVIHKENGGLISAREVAIEQATGEYIAFCDPDDWVDLDFYAQLVEALEQNEADVAIGHCVLEFEDSTENVLWEHKDCVMDQRTAMLYLLSRASTAALWDKVYRTDLIKGIILPQYVTVGEDFMRNWYIFLRAQRFAYTPVCGYHYRYREDSMSKACDKIDYPHTKTCVFDILAKESPLNDEKLRAAFWHRSMRSMIKDAYKLIQSSQKVSNEPHTRQMQTTIRQNLSRLLTTASMPLYYKVMACIMATPYTICGWLSSLITLGWVAKKRVKYITE